MNNLRIIDEDVDLSRIIISFSDGINAKITREGTKLLKPDGTQICDWSGWPPNQYGKLLKEHYNQREKNG